MHSVIVSRADDDQALTWLFLKELSHVILIYFGHV